MVRHPNLNTAWQRLRTFSNWRASVLPGLTLTGVVIILRMVGFLELSEWKLLDVFLRSRPAEPIDERVVIVGIDEIDIQSVVGYPLSDAALASLLKKLDTFGPRAVGVDIFRDLPVEPGHETFVKTLEELPYVFGIEFLNTEIAGPPSLPPERIGFVDFPLDTDGLVRRSLLGRYSESGDYRFSLAIRLAEAYLLAEGITIESGLKDPQAMRFSTAEIPAFNSDTGGYVGEYADAQQTLLNVKSGTQPFRKVSLREVMSGEVKQSWIQDKVVLIGITSPAHKDIVSSGAITGRNPGDVYGIEMQAHSVSQILSATLDGRPYLQAWPDAGEYLWILLWGAAGILLVGRAATPYRHLVWVALNGSLLIVISYVAIVSGWWLPLAPALAAFLLNGLVLPSVLVYDQMMRSRVEESQRVIRQTYSAVHNGPLQTLALLLREVDEDSQCAHVAPRLRQLNTEIRQLYDNLEQELEPQNNQLHLESTGAILTLDAPIHELLYQVYNQTLKRDFPNFQSVKCHVVKFDSLQATQLKIEDKRALCRFLEEALCNVGRYADGLTRLEVTCLTIEHAGAEHTGIKHTQKTNHKGENLIRVEDNGKGALAKAEQLSTSPLKRTGGRGTKQANQLAKRLRGRFSRTARSPTGTCCELRWPAD
ncbi:MAG: CHASE2 domain-containing protein [Cyanobacteria bacterium J06598_1]